jgi:exopolysaccharide production protein ExoQ
MTGVRWTASGTGTPPRAPLLGSSGAPTRVASTASARAWLAYPILVLLFAFMGPYSLHPAAATGDDNAVGASAAAAASGVEEGTRTRQIAVVLLAGFAALTLSATRRRRRLAGVARRPLMGTEYGGVAAAAFGGMSRSAVRALRTGIADASNPTNSRLLLGLLLAYTGLASVSVMWAGDPLLAAKRAVVFLVLAFAAYALAQAWSLREVLYFSLFANAASLGLGILGAIARGDFQPFTADYRYVGFANPNLHGIEAACLVIGAAVGLRVTKERRHLMIGLLVFGLGMLLLSKSRTALLALALSAMFAALVAVRSKRVAMIVIAAFAVIFTVVVFLPDSVTHAHNAALLGRSAESESPATLSGRTLLWEDLLNLASDRPLLGYGFDSFWTPAHIAEVSLRRGWVITQSHSGYIEALLNVGWLGASLLVLMLTVGLGVAIRRFRDQRTALTLFAVATMVWYMINMLAEAIPEAHFSTLLVMLILAHLGIRNAAPDDFTPAVPSQD